MRTITTIAVVAGTTLLLDAQTQPRFRTGVDLSVVSAVVRNAENGVGSRAGTRGLRVLLEDGKPVNVVTFAEASSDAKTSVDDGRFVVLLLDDLSTHPQYTQRIKDVAHGFADCMGPEGRDVGGPAQRR